MSSRSTAQAGRTTKAVEARRPTGTSAFTFNFLSMKTLNLGYPRIGSERELKWASEAYWAGKISLEDLIETGKRIRRGNWLLQKEQGVDLIPCNDFSFYDHVLDTACMFGMIPKEYEVVPEPLDRYFAMARGDQRYGLSALKMTKWWDTNYHYIVPKPGHKLQLLPYKLLEEVEEAKALGINVKPVIIGPYTFCYLSKMEDRLEEIIPLYVQLLHILAEKDIQYVQMDEPVLGVREDLNFSWAYDTFARENSAIKIILANYFEGYGKNAHWILDLPVDTLHLDLVRSPYQSFELLSKNSDKNFSLGLIDGRNVWKSDMKTLVSQVERAIQLVGRERLFLAPSCSLIHVPCDLDLETDLEIKSSLAFAKQKLEELQTLKAHFNGDLIDLLAFERQNTETSEVQNKVYALTLEDERRSEPFDVRNPKQKAFFDLPPLPTTTIGSFPQTTEIRKLRANLKKGEISLSTYEEILKEETRKLIKWQEDIGLDVLVHGEFERTDMVEYFGELLDGFAFTQKGWVQSYGSRCVKPPIIFGDVKRKADMTVKWSAFAQSCTSKWVKGMLTGPVTILQWSFVRTDQSRRDTCLQIALALREEVLALEKAGIRIIQVDEPGLREGLPLRKENIRTYLEWATRAFRVATSGVEPETQIHTHMCYAHFREILPAIISLDADVITLECARAPQELLNTFKEEPYPYEIGPGVYDIHSPRIPHKEEMSQCIAEALKVVPKDRLWVNPDCGLKTRKWTEVEPALKQMVAAARSFR